MVFYFMGKVKIEGEYVIKLAAGKSALLSVFTYLLLEYFRTLA